MNLFEKALGAQTRWSSFENLKAQRAGAALENNGAKGHAFDRLAAGETKTLLDVGGSGIVHRIWMTISDRSPEMLRSLRLDMTWDNAPNPAVSVPLGDFFGIGLGRKAPFECALFSDPEGRSFNSFVPMPFRTAARISVTNESGKDLSHLFYDINVSLDVRHSPETLYLHSHWRREAPNQLGKEFVVLPRLRGCGRFLGCNVGVMANPDYKETWWGEGEVKVWFGDDDKPTLCGTGTEDFIGTAWGQGVFAHRTQGCLVADSVQRQWAFYRYHVDDPIYFSDGCQVAIQTIGGSSKENVRELQKQGVPLIPISIDRSGSGAFVRLMDFPQPVDLRSAEIPDGWCNFWRQDDWSATAYFYLDAPGGVLPRIPPAAFRAAGLTTDGDPRARKDA